MLLDIDLVQDKAMMERWGLEGMESFEQKGVKAKEGARGKLSPGDASSAHTAVERGTTASASEVS